MPSLGAILGLRDKSKTLTLAGIMDLPNLQINIIRQLANAYERTLAAQIGEAIQLRFKQEPQVLEV